MPTFTSFDGLTIAYDEWGDAGGTPPVLLHHGFVADANLNWVLPGIVDALVADGHRVVAPDARGHGRSDHPHDASFYGEANMARDVSALVDRLGADEVDLVGYSMGSVVSLLVAAQDPRVRRLAIGGVGSGILDCGGVDRRALDNVTLAAALRADDPSTIADLAAAGFRAFVDAVGADRTALAAHADVVHTDPIPLERITAPTLVLAGVDDDLAAEPGRLAAAIPGAVLTMVPGDHLGAVATPELLAALRSFLS